MARISGIDLPRDKKVEIGLTYIFGIGRASALEIMEKAGIDPALRIRDLTDADVNKLRQVIEKEYRVEGALRTEVSMNIKRLMDIGSYRGTRHRRGLPVRGQRTHTNARTKKGPRRWRIPRYEPMSMSRLMFIATSVRSAPSTRNSFSITSRSLFTSASVRSRIRRRRIDAGLLDDLLRRRPADMYVRPISTFLSRGRSTPEIRRHG